MKPLRIRDLIDSHDPFKVFCESIPDMLTPDDRAVVDRMRRAAFVDDWTWRGQVRRGARNIYLEELHSSKPEERLSDAEWQQEHRGFNMDEEHFDEELSECYPGAPLDDAGVIAEPGTPGKVDAMIDRVARGVQPCHPDDIPIDPTDAIGRIGGPRKTEFKRQALKFVAEAAIRRKAA